MMIKRQGNVPKVTIHPVRISYHPLITQPTKGAIYPREIIHGIPNFPWLKKGTGPIIGPHPIGPIGPIGGPRVTLPISPINDYRKPPNYPINPIMPYHPITPVVPYHPITIISPIHPTQIVQKKVQRTTPAPQPDDSGAIGAGIGALMSIFLALI